LLYSHHAPPLLPSFPTRRSSDLDFSHLLRRQIVDAAAVEADLAAGDAAGRLQQADDSRARQRLPRAGFPDNAQDLALADGQRKPDRKSTRLNSSHRTISYAVFCL